MNTEFQETTSSNSKFLTSKEWNSSHILLRLRSILITKYEQRRAYFIPPSTRITVTKTEVRAWRWNSFK